jgi:hypothetical protein
MVSYAHRAVPGSSPGWRTVSKHKLTRRLTVNENYPNKFSSWNVRPSSEPIFRLGARLVNRMSGSIYQITEERLARDPQTNVELTLFALHREAKSDDGSYSGLLSAARLAESFYVLK